MRQLAEDGGGYLHTALAYAEGRGLEFPAGREPGYRVLIFLISLLTSWVSLSDLASNVVVTQIIVYVLLAGALTCEAWLRGGPFAAAVVALLFGFDRYNLQWMFDVQSEAPSRLLAFLGLLLLLVGTRRRSSVAIVIGLVSLGTVPLMRPSDLAVPAAAALGVAMWALCRRTWRGWWAAVGMLLVIAAPVFGWAMFHGSNTGYYGITERSAWHLAGRTLTVIPPEILRRSSMDAGYVEQVAVPVHAEYGPHRNDREPLINDLGQPTPLTRLITPSPRHEPPLLAGNLLKGRGEEVDDYRVAAFLDQQSRDAIVAAPFLFLKAIAPIVVDFAYLPIAAPLYDKSIRNKLALAIPFAWLVALALLAVRWREAGPFPRAAAVAAFLLLPLYWTGCAVAGYYAVRFGTLQHLAAALVAVFAAISLRAPDSWAESSAKLSLQ